MPFVSITDNSVCYKEAHEAESGTGDCDSWCTYDHAKLQANCGYLCD